MNIKNTILTFVSLLVSSTSLTFGQLLPGSLDDSFNGTGKVITPIGNNEDNARSVAIQSDGKIVVAGYTKNIADNYDIALLRYNSDGTLDADFDGNVNGNGVITTAIGDADDIAYSVAVQSDGKIVVTGYSFNGTNIDVVLLRYNTNGELDDTFNGDGIVITDIGGYETATSLIIQPNDSKILVAGTTSHIENNGNVNENILLLRYNTDGSLDNTFDEDGIVITPSIDRANAIAIQADDGKIVVAGFTKNDAHIADIALLRYNTDGSLDNTFDEDGIVITDIENNYDVAYSVAIQLDGKIVLAGATSSVNANNQDIALLRYNTNGELDDSFDGDANGNGIILTDMSGYGGDYGFITSVLIQPNDGKILAAGCAGEPQDFALLCYNVNGSLDNSFGDQGKVVTPISNFTNQGISAAIQPDGKKIVMVGFADSDLYPYSRDFAVVRYMLNLDMSTGVVNLLLDKNTVWVYPNPIEHEVLLEYTLLNDEVLKLELRDITGKLIAPIQELGKREKGSYKEFLSIPASLAAGNYILTLSNGLSNVFVKVVKN